LRSHWERLKKPDFFAFTIDNDWVQIAKHEYERDSINLFRRYRTLWEAGEPVFHHHHGILQLPWQLEMWHSDHPIQCVIGGFGSSKTWGKLIDILVRAATVPGYRAFCLAPYSIQAMEVYKQAMVMMDGTLFKERFLLKAPTKPYAQLVIGNDFVGENVIEIYSIMDDPDKLLTLSGDEAMIDQAEQLDEIDRVVRNIGTRLRGQVRGRPRRGQISLIANSADNPLLWDIFDEGATDPDFTWSYGPSTSENIYLTMSDLFRFERQVGADAQSRSVHLLGHRPIGAGEHFSHGTLQKSRSSDLEHQMQQGLDLKLPGYHKAEAPRVGIYEWELPYREDRIYMVAADPGWSNPPGRNSAGIIVWDITFFPKQPATLAAFHWVFGNNSPAPWLAKYTELVMRFHAVGRNAFDSTGPQSGYERVEGMAELQPTPVSMAGNTKYVLLTLTKSWMANGMFEMPFIPHIFSQLAKYRLPDAKLKQDLVMMILVAVAWLEHLFYSDNDDEFEHFPRPTAALDRYDRDPDARY